MFPNSDLISKMKMFHPASRSPDTHVPYSCIFQATRLPTMSNQAAAATSPPLPWEQAVCTTGESLPAVLPALGRLVLQQLQSRAMTSLNAQQRNGE